MSETLVQPSTAWIESLNRDDAWRVEPTAVEIVDSCYLYSELAPTDRDFVVDCARRIVSGIRYPVLSHFVRRGLVEVKARLTSEQWPRWLDQELQWSVGTATKILRGEPIPVCLRQSDLTEVMRAVRPDLSPESRDDAGNSARAAVRPECGSGGWISRRAAARFLWQWRRSLPPARRCLKCGARSDWSRERFANGETFCAECHMRWEPKGVRTMNRDATYRTQIRRACKQLNSLLDKAASAEPFWPEPSYASGDGADQHFWIARKADELKLPPWDNSSISDCAYCPGRWCEGHAFSVSRPRNCFNCSTAYSPLLVRQRTRNGNGAVLHGYEVDMDGGAIEWIFPCCSYECESTLQRKVNHHEKELLEQWESIKKARQLLKEARAWLRDPNPSRPPSQSQKPGSEQPTTSPG